MLLPAVLSASPSRFRRLRRANRSTSLLGFVLVLRELLVLLLLGLRRPDSLFTQLSTSGCFHMRDADPALPVEGKVPPMLEPGLLEPTPPSGSDGILVADGTVVLVL